MLSDNELEECCFFFFFFFYQVSSLYSDNMKIYCAGVEASIYYSDKQFPGYTVLFCICFALKIMYKQKKLYRTSARVL